MSVLINGTAYNEAQFNNHQVLSEELESGQVILMPTNSKLNIKPYDVIGLSALTDYYYLIDNYVCEEIRNTSSGNPLYRYTINYIEVTKYLQAIPLSNRSITQPIASWGTRRNCYEALDRILKSISFSISINATTQTLLESKECPEFSWNRPTLWEVLKDIFAQFDCLPKLTYLNGNYILKHKSLEKTNQTLPVNSDYIVSKTYSLGMNNYAKALDLEVENASSNVWNAFEERVQVRSEEGVLNSDNASFILEHNIYGVKRCVLARIDSITHSPNDEIATVHYKENGTEYNFSITYVDITDHICSAEIYNTLASSTDNTVDDDLYKRNYLYFDKNKIEGLSYKEKFLGIFSGSPAIACIIKNAVETKWHNDHPTATEWNFTFPAIATIEDYYYIDNIEYQTMDNLKVEIENEQSNGMNNVTLIDNQSDAYIDANAFAKIKQDNVNYMSNEVVMLNCIYKASETANIVNVGAVYTELSEDHIVFDRKMGAIQGNQYRVIYLASKKYPKLNRSMQLNQAKRYTQLASASSSFLRQENIALGNFYLTETSTSGDTLRNLCFDFNANMASDKKQYHIAKAFFYVGEPEEDSSKWFYLHSFNNRVGKSICLATKFYNNIGVGLQIISDSLVGGYPEQRVSYVNEYGELDAIEICMFTGLETVQAGDDYRDYLRKYPEAYSQNFPSDYLILKDLYLYKDNREQLGLTFQINFKDTNDFTINEGMLINNPLLLKTSSLVTLAAYKGDVVDNNVGITINNNRISLTNLTTNVSNYNIRDNNGNKIFTINKKTTSSSMNIYLAKE